MDTSHHSECQSDKPLQVLKFKTFYGGGFRTLQSIQGCLCDDGVPRYVRIKGEPETFFSIPAATRVNGKTVGGFVTCADGVYAFHATGANRGLIVSPNWTSLKDGKRCSIGDIIVCTHGLGRAIGFAARDGCGNPYPERRVVALMLGGDASHAFPNHVAVEDIQSARPPPKDGDFHKWFFSGTLASMDDLMAASAAGGLTDRYFAESCDDTGRWIPFSARTKK